MTNYTSHTTLANLRDSLVSLYPDVDSARRIGHDAGLAMNRIALHNDAVNAWHAILLNAQTIERIEELIEIVLHEFGTNQKLRNAVYAYRESQRAGQDSTIPFVTVAMTAKEAQELADETIFTNWPVVDGYPVPKRGNEQTRFDRVKTSLPENFFTGFTPERDGWKPYDGDRSVHAFVEQIAVLGGYKAQSYSAQLFAEEQATRQETVDYLQRIGCILIVDALSLFHPKLNYLLESSGLVSARESVPTLILAPLDHAGHPLNQIIENDIRLSPQMSTVLRRIDKPDLLCEFGVGGQRTLLRWLHTVFPKTAYSVRKEIADNAKVAQFQQSLAYKKTGIHRNYT